MYELHISVLYARNVGEFPWFFSIFRSDASLVSYFVTLRKYNWVRILTRLQAG